MPQKGIYKHYKGGQYKVIAFPKHSETLEDMVFYQKMEDGSYWVRPLHNFNQKVIVNGHEALKFEFLHPLT